MSSTHHCDFLRFTESLNHTQTPFLLRRRRKGNKKSRSTDEEKSEPSDPVELKRMTCQTPAMMDHPPIPVDELFDRINGMKAENNSKFTQEYEVQINFRSLKKKSVRKAYFCGLEIV